MLEDLRKEIKNCDKEIIRLLKRRMEISKNIGNYKIKNNIPIYDKEREESLFQDIKMEANNDLSEKAIEDIYKEIIFHSKELQKKLYKNE